MNNPHDPWLSEYRINEYGESFEQFADPGGNSALRAASKSNPRNLRCPTCDGPNRLTAKDRALGYQCNSCADKAEGVGYGEGEY